MRERLPVWSSGSPVPRIPIERLRLLVTGTIFAGDAAFVLEAGRATVRRGETVLATLGPGDWFGEMSVLLGEPRTATVVAATHGRMRRLTRDAFEQALKDDPAHAIAMLRQLAGRLRDTTRRT
jgi:CRP-like cAMP-binding protein